MGQVRGLVPALLIVLEVYLEKHFFVQYDCLCLVLGVSASLVPGLSPPVVVVWPVGPQSLAWASAPGMSEVVPSSPPA